MNRCSLVALLALAVSSCAGRGPTVVPDQAIASTIPESAQVLSLLGRFGMAHACPVAGEIVTAAHVAEGRDKGESWPLEYIYQQGTNFGVVAVSESKPPMSAVDLAWLSVTDDGEIDYNDLADTLSVGDKVYWFQFDFTSVGSMLSVVRKESTVIRIIAGHFVTETHPSRGASGGCYFNDSDEVVGIVHAIMPVTTTYSQWGGHSAPRWTGVGVILTKEWNW